VLGPSDMTVPVGINSTTTVREPQLHGMLTMTTCAGYYAANLTELKILGAFVDRFGVELMPNKVFGFRMTSIISSGNWELRVNPQVGKSVPNRCPIGTKSDALGATASQAKGRVVARLAH
jgi:hypothetical protein